MCFLFGDLNYRINIYPEIAVKLISNHDLVTLIEYDQFLDEVLKNNVKCNNFKEGFIKFNHTYKYYPEILIVKINHIMMLLNVVQVGLTEYCLNLMTFVLSK